MKHFNNLHKLFKTCLLLIAFGLYTWNGYAQINLTAPGATYTENFDATTIGATLPTGWVSIDANSDGVPNSGAGKWNIVSMLGNPASNVGFGGTGNCLAYLWNATNAANDWAITPAFTLAVGSYRINLKYAATAAGTVFPEKLKIFLGTAATVAGMSPTPLKDYDNINSATYADDAINFTISTPGTYFIGFNAYSAADQYALRIDNLQITNVVANDVAFSSVTTTASPTNCASYTATTPINIQIANLGSANQTNVQVNYSVTRNGSAFVSGNVTVPTINSATTASASFNLDMTVGGTYVVSATTALAGDAVAGNNTGSATLLNPVADLMADGAAYLQTFESATTTLASVGWQANDANADAVTWTILNNAGFTNQVNPGTKAAICFRSQTVASNDWLFSNCLKLKGGKTYTVSFYRRANGGTSEKLKLSYGTTTTAAGMTNLIQDYGTFNTNSFVLVTNTFTPATDGTYYLGWQNYGDAINAPANPAPPAAANGIIIDDVYIVNPAANDLALTTATTTVNTCSMTNATPVTITFANAGTAAFASTFTWEVRNAVTNTLLASSPVGNPVVVPSIAVGATGTVNINYDFSTPGTVYSLRITLANDGTNINNERTFTFVNARRDLSANNSSYFENVDGVAGGLGWTNFDGNADNTTWGLANNATFAASGAGYFSMFSSATVAANDLLFSPCLTLKAGKVYNISFKYRTNTVGQNLSLILTNVNNSATPTEIQTIQTYPALLSNGAYLTSATLPFFVPLASGDGTYYIVFKTTMPSSVATQAIRIDDITITNTGTDALPPNTPLLFSAASTVAFTADLTWSIPATTTSFILERSLSAGSGFAQIATPAGTATSYQDAGLVGGTQYFYRLTAVNQYGNAAPIDANVTVLSPPAPTGLTATSPSVLTINLSWTDLANETGYIVERSITPGSGFAQIGSNQPANTVTYIDNSGLNAGTTYYYRVRAIYAGGNSAPSNEANAMPMAPPQVTGLTAVAPSNTVSPLTINLSWTDVAGETGFTIQRSTTSGTGFTNLATVAANVITYTDNNNLTGGTTYFYRVIANFALGNAVPSAQASATALNPPVPANFPANALTASNITAISAVLNWVDVLYETSFDIERAAGINQTTGFSVVGSVNQGVVTFTNTGLAPNTGYTYRVIAKNVTGTSTSNTVNVTTLNVPIPVAPSNLTATYTVSSPFAISLAWNDVTGEDSYLIERKTGALGTFAQIGTTSANIVGYVDNNLTANTTYFYRVKAKNVSGDSPASNEASATVLSIENNAISQQTSLFPNPNNGEFAVKLPSMKIQKATFNLVDAQGRKVFTSTKENDNADQFDFQLMNLPKGVYMLHIDTSKGQAVKRVVIK